eukprot:gnl/Chilomastix_cuspidata/1658.p1 GENE.gnl/Chilomastix_cuspidata/1658~~gnl/Chilomastix_cuspidata/1658.p1  ORF type:complete len:479 (+),score=180.82 gnl/Chilomastix_cuspidata/1658:26-1438(+)
MSVYDLVVVGAGPGGYVGAIRAAQLGLKVACVEKAPRLGGTCLNVGCIPSKSLLHSSHMYHEAKHKFAEHGVLVSGLELDLPAMHRQREGAIETLTGGIEHLFAKNGIDRIEGTATPEGKTVRVRRSGERDLLLDTRNVLLATGSRPKALPFAPFDDVVVDSTAALSFPEVPRELVIVGGGVIGCELGSVWARLGAKVTIVEYADSILPGVDSELSKALQRHLTRNERIKFVLGAAVQEVTREKGRAAVCAVKRKGGKQLTFDADKVLVTIGREPSHGGVDLAALGVATTRWGQIEVENGTFATSRPGYFAIGDVVPGPMLAHKASEEAVRCVEALAGKPARALDYAHVPGVVYTTPELAGVGLTEDDAKAQGVPYRVGRFFFRPNSRCVAVGETAGLVKVICAPEAAGGAVLGLHVFGPNASDIVHEGLALVAGRVPVEAAAQMCHAHPTFSEAVREALLDAHDRAIHS